VDAQLLSPVESACAKRAISPAAHVATAALSKK